ncbi:MAG UNVERIFIED_CONTAM: Gfo/Idh/MocA family oxidoreductase [Planctomycetaceae bacterium]
MVFAVSHNYTGYPLVRQAREMILSGELGEINAIRSNYIQGWLRTRLEESDQKQAAWRTDPKRSGAAGCFGDIGTHAYNLGRYMTGLLPSEISCSLKVFAEGRALDDYGHAVIRYENGAIGTVTASQISHGRENDLFIEIDGTKGALQWRQEEPNVMIVRRNGSPHQMYTRDPNAPFMNTLGRSACRLPSGHPEAFFEAFANVYRFAYDAMVAACRRTDLRTTGYHLPQCLRRRRRHVFYPAVRGQQQSEWCLAVAEVSARTPLIGEPVSSPAVSSRPIAAGFRPESVSGSPRPSKGRGGMMIAFRPESASDSPRPSKGRGGIKIAFRPESASGSPLPFQGRGVGGEG